jgi:hypothetical protein
MGRYFKMEDGTRVQVVGIVEDGKYDQATEAPKTAMFLPFISPRFARIEIIETIALVHLEVQQWSGRLASANARASDVFTLLKGSGGWLITHKLFHWQAINPHRDAAIEKACPHYCGNA